MEYWSLYPYDALLYMSIESIVVADFDDGTIKYLTSDVDRCRQQTALQSILSHQFLISDVHGRDSFSFSFLTKGCLALGLYQHSGRKFVFPPIAG